MQDIMNPSCRETFASRFVPLLAIARLGFRFHFPRTRRRDVSCFRRKGESGRKSGEAVPQTDKQGKKKSTKGQEEPRRDTKGLIDELLIAD